MRRTNRNFSAPRGFPSRQPNRRAISLPQQTADKIAQLRSIERDARALADAMEGSPTAVVRHHATQIQRARATANTQTIVSQAHTGIVNDFHQFDGYAEEYGLTNSRTDPLEDTDIKIIDLDEMVKPPFL